MLKLHKSLPPALVMGIIDPPAIQEAILDPPAHSWWVGGVRNKEKGSYKKKTEQ